MPSTDPGPDQTGGARASERIYPDLPDFPEEPSLRLSPLRCLSALVVLAVVVYGIFWGVSNKLDAATGKGRAATWFAPYVDATLIPTYQFQNAANNPARQTVLGFVVADPHDGCSPSWGAAYSIAQADQSLSLRSRIAELREEGATAIVSFGGQAHTELALACTSTARLENAYQTVVSHYDLSAIDLDIEGAALSNTAATQRRATAIRQLQGWADRNHHKLAVWVTLPVEPDGLQSDALSVLDSLLAARVDLAGVDVMSMDFSSSPHGSMLNPVEASARAAESQLASQFRRYGVHLSSTRVWEHLGVTVMIGQNDVAGQRFTTGDASGLVRFAERRHLGRVSMWSLNRDAACGSVYPVTGTHSNTCSGTPQNPLQFSKTFAALNGSVTSDQGTATPPAPDSNPADAPYPIWSPTTAYQQGYKVVLNGYIYQAKWYNTGQSPAVQVQDAWETPWALIGPVVAGSKVSSATTLRPGTYPAWSQGRLYHKGDKVLFAGLPYQARWNNQGVSPETQASDPYGSAWQALYKIAGEPSGN